MIAIWFVDIDIVQEMQIMTRQQDREKHENYIIEEFVKSHNKSFGTRFWLPRDHSPTESPDRYYLKNGKKGWIETTDIYHDKSEAEYLWKSIDQDPSTKPFIVCEPNLISDCICNDYFKKVCKPSYEKLSQDYGPGTLVLSVESRLFTKADLEKLKSNMLDIYRLAKNDFFCPTFFGEVFLRFRFSECSHRFIKIFPQWGQEFPSFVRDEQVISTSIFT